MNPSKYPPNWYSHIRPFIIERDNNTCQVCGVKAGEEYTSPKGKVIKAKLAVAHLDHDAENHAVSMDRLQLMCDCCHLAYDKEDNKVKSKKAPRRPYKKKPAEITGHIFTSEAEYEVWKEGILKHDKKDKLVDQICLP